METGYKYWLKDRDKDEYCPVNFLGDENVEAVVGLITATKPSGDIVGVYVYDGAESLAVSLLEEWQHLAV